ncbi:MAG: rplQ [Chlamydiia bacterium]|nr:rplQ [Chlamydiia bacterium]
MRHMKKSCKLGRTAPHRRCMFANMLKSLIQHERMVTTPAKAKELRRFADQMITLAKKDTLHARRQAVQNMMIRYNALSPKEARAVREGDTSAYNGDRKVIQKLFQELGPRFMTRQGGYTRIIRLPEKRVGDNAEQCIIEYLPA